MCAMQMLYKEDWPQARERLCAFWARSALDRPALQVTAPRRKPIPGPEHPPVPDDLVRRWTDPEYVVSATDYWFRHTYFGGEAIPSHFVNLGPGIMATYIGSEPTFHPGTVWFGPVNYNYDRPLQMDENNRWWQVTLRLTRISSEFFEGKGMTAITDLGGGSDILASLRTTEGLLLDMVENPAPIRAAMLEIAGIWMDCYRRLFAITSAHFEGSVQWLGVWAPGKMYNIQSDFCCMVSPRMFEEFIAPELETLCAFLDYSLYHLDGPGAIHHLDRILAIPDLDGIQWTPGDGSPPVTEWIPMLKKIQKAGKCLHLHGSPAHAERVLRALKPEGLMYRTWCSSQDEAEELIRKAARWAAGPREE